MTIHYISVVLFMLIYFIDGVHAKSITKYNTIKVMQPTTKWVIYRL